MQADLVVNVLVVQESLTWFRGDATFFKQGWAGWVRNSIGGTHRAHCSAEAYDSAHTDTTVYTLKQGASAASQTLIHALLSVSTHGSAHTDAH
eukprot:1147430-Pelagomonas_calceolata.AAC.5